MIENSEFPNSHSKYKKQNWKNIKAINKNIDSGNTFMKYSLYMYLKLQSSQLNLHVKLYYCLNERNRPGFGDCRESLRF